jgi:hypothetical protein
MHTKRQPVSDLIKESNRGPLVAPVVDLQDTNAGAVVDRGELVEARPRARNALEEFHVDLQPVSWLGFLVALPAFGVGPMLLISRQSIQVVTRQDAVHRRHGQ